MPGTPSMRLALVDDHRLFRKGLLSLLEMVCSDCTILFEADSSSQHRMAWGRLAAIAAGVGLAFLTVG